jgi:hypothetical protein
VLGNAIRASTRLIYGRDGNRVQALRDGVVPLLKVGARTLRR